MVARVLLAAIAVLAIAWTAVLLRDYELGHAAASHLTRPASDPAQRERALDRLRKARLLNPDSTWEVGRAGYYLFIGRQREAARLSEQIVRGEPANITAWNFLRLATARSDPRRSAQAAAAIRRLDPLSSR